MTRRIVLLNCACAIVLVATARDTPAATISWYPFGNLITIDSDVQNTGDLYAAYAFGGPAVTATTVNGVLFSPFSVPASTSTTVGNATVSTPTAGVTVNGQDGVFGSASGYFSTLFAAYKKLLASGVTTSPETNAAPLDVTVDGLTIGQQYRVQLWVNDSRATPSNRTESILGGPTLTFNLGSSEGSIGQYAYGEFTADAAQQIIQIQGTVNTSVTQVNALAVFAVPEPATLTLVAIAACLGLTPRRRAGVPR